MDTGGVTPQDTEWTSQKLLAELGSEMLRSGTPVPEVARLLREVCARWDIEATVAVFPTLVVVAVAGQRDLQVDLANTPADEVRLDRSAAVLALVRSLADGASTLIQGTESFRGIQKERPRFGPVLRSFGHGISALGIALLFQVAVPTLIGATLLGALAGFLKLFVRRGIYLSAVFPTILSLTISALAFSGASIGVFPHPIYALVPALVTLLPGAQLVTSILELATGDLVSGSSRLVAGILQLVFLAVGVAMAVTLFSKIADAPLLSLSISELSFGIVGTWVGVLILGIGFWLYYCGPRRSLLPILFCLVAAYAGQQLGNLIDAPIGAFVGATFLAVVASVLHGSPKMPPLLVVFLPAFWLLAPGAIGLVGVSDAISQSQLNQSTFFAFASALLAIALGTATGFGLTRGVADRKLWNRI